MFFMSPTSHATVVCFISQESPGDVVRGSERERKDEEMVIDDGSGWILVVHDPKALRPCDGHRDNENKHG